MAQMYLRWTQVIESGASHVLTHESVKELVFGFHSRLKKLSSPALDRKLKGKKLFRMANLSPRARNVVIGSAGGSCSLQAISTTLRSTFLAGEMLSTSISTFRLNMIRGNNENCKNR